MVKKLFLLFLLSSYLLANDILTMVYRTTAKEPFISGELSSEGLWKESFEKAAKKIGVKLVIKRYPKNRAYQKLEMGTVDFYPASSYKPSREKIGFFIDSGFEEAGVGILYRDDLNISTVADIKNYELLNNMGSTTFFYDRAGINLKQNQLRRVPELDINRAFMMLQNKMSDIYAYSDVGIKKYLLNQENEGVKLLLLKLDQHKNFLLFSKKSKYYKEKLNPNFDSSKKLGIDNLPYILDENSIAYKFQEALKDI